MKNIPTIKNLLTLLEHQGVPASFVFMKPNLQFLESEMD